MGDTDTLPSPSRAVALAMAADLLAYLNALPRLPTQEELATRLEQAYCDALPAEPIESIRAPSNARDILRLILDAGGACHIGDDDVLRAGGPENRGQPLPCDALGGLGLICHGLLMGERERLLVTRVGRRLAADGVLLPDEAIATTDVNLAMWARGYEYPQTEVLEAVEAILHRVVLDRREALDAIIKAGLIAPCEARRDV